MADTGIGLSLPIQKAGNGYFGVTYENSEQVKHNLKNLLLTRKGERLMQPDLGTSLHEKVFEPNTATLALEIEDEIKSAIEKWLPYVVIHEIVVDRRNEYIDANKVLVDIKYSLTTDPALIDNFTLTIEGD